MWKIALQHLDNNSLCPMDKKNKNKIKYFFQSYKSLSPSKLCIAAQILSIKTYPFKQLKWFLWLTHSDCIVHLNHHIHRHNWLLVWTFAMRQSLSHIPLLLSRDIVSVVPNRRHTPMALLDCALVCEGRQVRSQNASLPAATCEMMWTLLPLPLSRNINLALVSPRWCLVNYTLFLCTLTFCASHLFYFAFQHHLWFGWNVRSLVLKILNWIDFFFLCLDLALGHTPLWLVFDASIHFQS